jgi:hypothetical protein
MLIDLHIAAGNLKQAKAHIRAAQQAELVTLAHMEAARAEAELDKAASYLSELLEICNGQRAIGSKDE